MSWFWVRPGIRRSFRLGIFRRRRRQDELADEVALHLEMRTAQLVARGLAPETARAEALRRLGSSTFDEALGRLLPLRTRAERGMRRRGLLDAIRQDAGFALRQLRRSPGFTLAVVSTLALAIGATATMFGIVDRLMLRPPEHVLAPDEVRRVFVTYVTPEGGRTIAHASWDAFEEARRSVTSAQVAGSRGETKAVGRGESAARENVRFVTAGFFELLGTRPRLGRFPTAEESHHQSGARVAVLGHGAWIRRFGGDEAVLGETIQVEGLAHTIIGVAPAGFHGPDAKPVELWLPMATMHALPTERFLFSYGNAIVELVARPRSGATEVQVAAELSRAITGAARGQLRPSGRPAPTTRADLAPLTGALGFDMTRTREATVAIWLSGISIILLLVACANVASLFALRAEQRSRELAVRLALGVGRTRLALQLFTECATVVLLGGVAAYLVTASGGAWLRGVLLPDVAWDGWATDRRVLLLTIAALVTTALLTGLAPAAHAWRASHRGLLAGAARSSAGATRRSWVRRPLLLAQTALSVLLLVGAGLFLRSLHELRSIDLGMQPERVIAVTADFANAGWRTAEISAFGERVVARLRELPGVEGIALAESVPFLSSIGSGSVRIPGRDSIVASHRGSPTKSTVSPEYFAVMGMRLVRGRGIEPGDRTGTPLVAVINETMAQRYWPDGTAVGDCFFVGNVPQCFTVIGIVRDAKRFGYEEDAWPHYFLALDQQTFAKHLQAVLVRTRGDARRSIAAVQEALRGVAPELPLIDVVSLQERIDPQARPWKLGATVLTVYGAFAVFLSALGLYSAMAYGVAARSRELGVRIAIGARSRQILRLILADGLRIGVVGLGIGLGLTIIAADRYSERLTTLLFRVAPTDLAVLGGVVAVLLAAVLLASLIPAWRATRVDPLIAMRAE